MPSIAHEYSAKRALQAKNVKCARYMHENMVDQNMKKWNSVEFFKIIKNVMFQHKKLSAKIIKLQVFLYNAVNFDKNYIFQTPKKHKCTTLKIKLITLGRGNQQTNVINNSYKINFQTIAEASSGVTCTSKQKADKHAAEKTGKNQQEFPLIIHNLAP